MTYRSRPYFLHCFFSQKFDVTVYKANVVLLKENQMKTATRRAVVSGIMTSTVMETPL